MNKIKSLADLKKIKDEVHTKIELREKGDQADKMIQIKVAMATCGIASGAKNVMDYLITELDRASIDAVITQTGCMGYCYAEPTIEIRKPGEEPIVFGYVTIAKATEIIDRYIKNGELVDGIIPVNYQSI